MKRFSFLLIALLLSVVLLTSGCGGDTGGDGGDGGDAPGEEMVLVHNVGTEPETMDPHLSTGVPEATIMLQIYEGLARLNNDSLPELALAESVEVSEDDLIYTFHLRDGLVWSNGEQLTAEDFELSWKRALDPELAADYAYMLYYIKGAEAYNTGTGSVDGVMVEALDEKTLQVTLEAPTPFFMSLVAFKTYYPLYQPAIEADPEGWHLSADTIIGNGPFKLESWAQGQMDFVPNENYYDADAVILDRLVFTMVENESTELTMYETGEIDVTHTVPGPEIPRLQQTGELYIFPYFGTYYYIFQVEKPPLDDVRVRKALTLAIDRDALVTNVTQGGQLPAYAYVPSGIPEADGSDFRENGGDYFTYDPETAKQLLADAGYPDGVGFPSVEILYNTSEMHKLIAEAIQEMWKQNLGIENVTLTNQEWGVYLNTRDEGDFMIARAGWIGDYLDPYTFLDMWVTGGGNNNSRWSNADYDRILTEVRMLDDEVARMEMMHQLEDILMEEMPIAPIYYYTLPIMIKDYVKGYSKAAVGGLDFKTAYIEK
ncbi:MAG: peptide ABC transporter substrate-binding protein [Bacillota bacterium]|nr:peptide ABC transporter substrate-binding protein [Bacillota bacterium]